jgi:transcriptional regulator with GAF, ATPase, and Fis domain
MSYPQSVDIPEAVAVLAVSPNERLHLELRQKMSSQQWNLIAARSGAEALEYLYERPSDMLLLDPMLPDLKASEFQAMVQERFPAVQVLTVSTLSGHLVIGSTAPTVASSRLVTLLSTHRPAEQVETRTPVQVFRMQSPEKEPLSLRGMIGDCEAMQQVYELTRKVARHATTVLVTGESGTGKDLIAQAVHEISPRQKQPLVTINCAAIPEALLEAELFGHVKGSFTGAVQSRIGRIQAAHGGTLFLDEIGDMPLSLQSKILRFLEQGEIQRVGGNENLKVDVRVIAATNADLKSLAAAKMFREDLYYRLAVFPIKLPPLRERGGDLEQLCKALLRKFGVRLPLHEGARQVLASHHWPGNVRELRNVLERAAILAEDEPEILGPHIHL